MRRHALFQLLAEISWTHLHTIRYFLQLESWNAILSDEPYRMVDQAMADLDGDGKKESIELYTYTDESGPTLTQHVKISVNAQTKELVYEKPQPFSGVRLNGWVHLGGANQGFLVQLDDLNEQKLTDPQPAYYRNYADLLFSYEKGSLLLLLDSLNQPFMKANNYSMSYTGKGDSFQFVDRATGMDMTYSIFVDDSYRKVVDSTYRTPPLMENIQPIVYYNSIKAEDMNGDGIDEIVCTKYIPGFYFNHILGFISYIYENKGNRFELAREVLFNSSSYYVDSFDRNDKINITLIKELLLQSGN